MICGLARRVPKIVDLPRGRGKAYSLRGLCGSALDQPAMDSYIGAIGLATKAVPADKLEEETERVAKSLCLQPRDGIAIGSLEDDFVLLHKDMDWMSCWC